MALPCQMDAFGIITRRDRLLSPAAKVYAARTQGLGDHGLWQAT